MVFGARLAEAIEGGRDGPRRSGALGADAEPGSDLHVSCRGLPPLAAVRRGDDDGADPAKGRERLQRAMTEGAGVLRSAASLEAAATVVDPMGAVAPSSPEEGELANLAVVARAVLVSAAARAETRGAHARVEYPDADPSWRCRLVHGDAALLP
jgi:L-aspartate oxidase